MLVLLLFVLGTVGTKLLYPFSYGEAIERWASVYSIDPYLVAGIVRTESHFRARATSSAGAIGLMQIMPATGEWITGKIGTGEFTTNDLYDPENNVRLGVWYLRYLIDRFGNVETALAAYNAGPGSVERWQGDARMMFPETAQYVSKVTEGERVYRLLYTLPFLGPLLRAIAI